MNDAFAKDKVAAKAFSLKDKGQDQAMAGLGKFLEAMTQDLKEQEIVAKNNQTLDQLGPKSDDVDKSQYNRLSVTAVNSRPFSGKTNLDS